MKIHLASHYGMCFGVRDAVALTRETAAAEPVTVLGQLVHNPVVSRQLDELGAGQADLDSPGTAPTRRVVITAHGASSIARERWQQSGHEVVDTTCPLVKKAHHALATLVRSGYHPVVIGQKGHVEVRGLIGDFPEAHVLSSPEEIEELPAYRRIGIVSQTTQPIRFVDEMVSRIRSRHPHSDVRFLDTVCQPTKDRQNALDRLCKETDTVVVVGGRNSNNTRQLRDRVESLGCRAFQVEGLQQSGYATDHSQ